MINRSDILKTLPPVQARRDVITDNQDTKDIIREVVEAHKFFAGDYDKICKYFAADDREEVYVNLFNFLKQNVKYKIERDALQTTRSPAALVGIGSGDCKHYAGFIGGVLDALNRKGYHFDWCYRFASYDNINPIPQHVFVVVREGNKEIWIDPVLSALNIRNPNYFFKTDKKVNMLQRIYGVGDALADKLLFGYSSGWNYFSKIYGSGLSTTDLPCKFFVDGEPFDLPVQAHILNEQGKGSLIEPVPQGLTVQYPAMWMGKPVRPDMLKPSITLERRMVIVNGGTGALYNFDGNEAANTNPILIADNNRLLNLLAASMGAIQMAYQRSPDAENLQRWYHRILDLRLDNDYLVPMEVKTLVGSFNEAFVATIKIIGKGFMTFSFLIPRTAFLQLIRLNAFDMAAVLFRRINTTDQPSIQKKWEAMGGAWHMLYNAAKDGSTKHQLLGIGEPATITTAGLIASASAVIALLAEFLKSQNNPKLSAAVDGSIGIINTYLKASGEDPIAVAQSIPGGRPVAVTTPGGTILIPPNKNTNGYAGEIMQWAGDNPILAAGAAGGIVLVGAKVLSKKRRHAY